MHADAIILDAGARFPVRQISATVTWIAGIGGGLATIALLYPGRYPFDSAYQLWQARIGVVNDLSPVVMTALWRALLHATGNPASLFCLDIALFWAGLVLCAISIARRAAARILLLIVFGMAPLTLVQMAHVLTDAHLAAVLVLATGLCARSIATKQRATLVAAAALVLYAGSIRHNALLAILPFGAYFALSSRSQRSLRQCIVVGFAGAGAICIVSALLALGLDRTLADQRANVWPTIALWDLAAISVDRRVLLLPPFTHGPGMTAAELSDTGAFDVLSATLLFTRSHSGMRYGIDVPYTRVELRGLFGAWLTAIVRYPLAYAHHRLRTFWLLIGPHRGDAQRFAFYTGRVQYRDNPPLPTAIAPRAQRAFDRFADALRATWLFAGLPYILLNVIACILGWRHRNHPTARLGLTVGSAALLYAAGFLPLAPAAELRYLTWTIIAAPLAIAFAWRGPAYASEPVRGAP